MNVRSVPVRVDAPAARPASAWDAFARRAVLPRLERIRDGRLEVEEEGRVRVFGSPSAALPGPVRLRVRDPRFWRSAAFGGSVGAGESYALGYWDAEPLTGLVRLFARNRGALQGLDGGWARLLAPLRTLAHALQRNTRAGSLRNIAAHYDLGNDFYRLFLDPSMMYSCAVFERPDATLEEASRAKLDRVCRKLDLGPGDHVLEIGCGWGGFAVHAAASTGCRVTATTISEAQHAFAVERVGRLGLSDRVTILRRDYRELEGRYSRLVSIEMIEAVGWQFYDEFFRTCSARLADDGLMLLQGITIRDHEYERAKRDVDFIKRCIFPGSCIPSVSALLGSMARASDLVLVHHEEIGPHYARTLLHWRERFRAAEGDLERMGFGEPFRRLWEFYLCYCEGGFLERSIGDAQLLMAKPGNRRDPVPSFLGGAR
jgi:cyclopropane-fatty-acyl-phospholipid synthase